nr:hypothetical protein [Pseudescherichia vulneris]
MALAFVPFAGEARAASMLGRFGERFVAGSRLGAAQAVATVPFTAMAAAADGDDFTYGNALESTFFNTLAGGLMHAGGGVISDLVRPRRAAEPAAAETAIPTPDAQPTPVVTPDNIPAGVNIPERGTNSDLAAAISSDAENYAYSRAYDDVVPEYMAQQRELQTGQIDNVADLRAELTANQRQADALDATVQQRTTDYQAQRMKFRDARARALKDVQAEKDALTSRNAEINNTLEQNAAAEQARGRQSQVNTGEIPDDLKVRIAERAQQIRDGMQMSPVAGAVRTAAGAIREADWAVNQQAYRAALAHMMEGRSPDVEPFYELHTPALRERAIQRIQNPVRQMDDTARPVSETADRVYRETQQADHEVTAAAADLENEFNLSNALLDDIAV